jgi:hypothetical protein
MKLAREISRLGEQQELFRDLETAPVSGKEKSHFEYR